MTCVYDSIAEIKDFDKIVCLFDKLTSVFINLQFYLLSGMTRKMPKEVFMWFPCFSAYVDTKYDLSHIPDLLSLPKKRGVVGVAPSPCCLLHNQFTTNCKRCVQMEKMRREEMK